MSSLKKQSGEKEEDKEGDELMKSASSFNSESHSISNTNSDETQSILVTDNSSSEKLSMIEDKIDDDSPGANKVLDLRSREVLLFPELSLKKNVLSMEVEKGKSSKTLLKHSLLNIDEKLKTRS